MNQSQEGRGIHFHIHWAGVKRLDWEPFETREHAEACAKELSQPNEMFVIEEYDQNCTRCGSKMAAAG